MKQVKSEGFATVRTGDSSSRSIRECGLRVAEIEGSTALPITAIDIALFLF
jgi:hypothetical protein